LKKREVVALGVVAAMLLTGCTNADIEEDTVAASDVKMEETVQAVSMSEEIMVEPLSFEAMWFWMSDWFVVSQDIDMTQVYLYGSCELGGNTLSFFRNLDNELVVTNNIDGEEVIVAAYQGWDIFDYEGFESAREKGYYAGWLTAYDNLFGFETVMLDVPIGANCCLYMVIANVEEQVKTIFCTEDRGLIVSDADGDGKAELVSGLEGYYYDWQDRMTTKCTAVFSDDVRQFVYEEEQHAWQIRYTDNTVRQGKVAEQVLAVPLIQVFSQEDVKVVPELTIDSFEEAVRLGEVEEMRGGVPGAVEGTWYIVTIDDIEYYYYKYDFREKVSEGGCEPYYAIIGENHTLANGIHVGMSEEEVLALYPNMAVMDFEDNYIYDRVTGHQGWNFVGYPNGERENASGMVEAWTWTDQFDYIMIGDIDLGTYDTLPLYIGLMMKDKKIAVITFYYPTAG